MMMFGGNGDDRKDGEPPARILEVAAEVRLQEGYGARDGDWVEVEVMMALP